MDVKLAVHIFTTGFRRLALFNSKVIRALKGYTYACKIISVSRKKVFLHSVSCIFCSLNSGVACWGPKAEVQDKVLVAVAM